MSSSRWGEGFLSYVRYDLGECQKKILGPWSYAPGCGEEQRNSELTEGEVRVHRHVPDLTADAAEDERCEERPVGEAERDRLQHAGEGDRQRAERDPERDADEERNEVRFVQLLQRVSSRARGDSRRAGQGERCGDGE